MKAWVYDQYGSVERLRLEERPRPTPAKGEVRVGVVATSLNASDVEFLTGSPLYIRAWGLRRPRFPVLGSDIAGEIEAVGPGVNAFAVGDAVYGDVLGTFGGLAEAVCAPADRLRRIPSGLGFELAAALPQAAALAWQSIHDVGRLTPGQSVLINGAGGGAGSFAIQLAKHLGAGEVTGVDAAHKRASMTEDGADHTIDYRQQDFTADGRRYDLILDFVASHSIFDYRRALAKGGRYLMVGGKVRHLISTLAIGWLLSRGSRELKILAAEPNEGLDAVERLVASGALKPRIDAVLPLAEAPEGLRCLHEGRARGKVVVWLAPARRDALKARESINA